VHYNNTSFFTYVFQNHQMVQEVVRRQFIPLWVLAYLQILPGGSVPILTSFRRIRNGGARTTFQIFPSRHISVEPQSEIRLPLNLRFLIDYPGSFHFANPDRVKHDRPHIRISPCVAGTEVKYIADLAVMISNTGKYRARLSPSFPVLEIIAYSRRQETPLRLCNRIMCDWRKNNLGHSFPVYDVQGAFPQPYF
jgi:hypothetical protein